MDLFAVFHRAGSTERATVFAGRPECGNCSTESRASRIPVGWRDVEKSHVKKKVIVVMPAYNAQKTVEKTVADIPRGAVDEIILVDDCSKDETVAVAKKLGLKVIRHTYNLGYGGNQKTCYKSALAAGADIVVMVHPVYQYDARLVPHM